MAKRKQPAGLIIGVRKLRGGGHVTDGGDDDKRLYLDVDALIGEGTTVQLRRVGFFLSDADAHVAVLRLLANMRPRWRNKTVRFIEMGGLGPKVKRAKPSTG